MPCSATTVSSSTLTIAISTPTISSSTSINTTVSDQANIVVSSSTTSVSAQSTTHNWTHSEKTISSSAIKNGPTSLSAGLANLETNKPTQKHTPDKHLDEDTSTSGKDTITNSKRVSAVKEFLQHDGNNKKLIEKRTAQKEVNEKPKDSPDLLNPDIDQVGCALAKNDVLSADINELVEALPFANTVTLSSRQQRQQPSDALSQEYLPPAKNRRVVDRLREGGKDMFIYNTESENDDDSEETESITGRVNIDHPAVAMDVDDDVTRMEEKTTDSFNNSTNNNGDSNIVVKNDNAAIYESVSTRMDAAKRLKLFQVIDEDEHLRRENKPTNISTTSCPTQSDLHQQQHEQRVKGEIKCTKNDASVIGNISAVTVVDNSTFDVANLKTFDFGNKANDDADSTVNNSTVPTNLKTFDFGNNNRSGPSPVIVANYTEDEGSQEESSDESSSDDDDVTGCEHNELKKCWPCYLIWSSRQPLPQYLIEKASEQGECVCHR